MLDLLGPGGEVRDIPMSTGHMTKFDRMLYGEFVRRNHGRFAHEAALYGVPGPDGPRLHLSDNVSRDVASIAGLLARSHTMPLRRMSLYLDRPEYACEYRGGRISFLAAVLRAADYLEVTAERAPKEALSVQSLLSPRSVGEWKANQAIQDISHNNPDPEALRIEALPEDVETYLKVREWLDGFQAELDASWAVLGEVYGRYENLSRLGLNVRRVHSTVDDVAWLAQRVNFVPRETKMQMAEAAVSTLLVGPLYDYNPFVGIRELMQNAIDAVREYRDLRENRHQDWPASYSQEGDVEIWVGRLDEHGQPSVTVTDKGIGMTEQVIQDYFLTAGATYRSSDEWKDLHEQPDARDHNMIASRVLRTGRFGVGVLAAFLLGDSVQVTTRHFEAPESRAICFTLQPDAELVELKYCRAPVGTRIEIKTSLDILEKLRGDPSEVELGLVHLYALDWPKVVLRQGEDGRHDEWSNYLPGQGSALPLDWHRIDTPGFADFQWSSAETSRSASSTCCNGIPIGSRRVGSYVDGGTFGTSRLISGGVLVPKECSIFDPDGRLPLGLTKAGCVYVPEINCAVAKDVLEWFCAWMLTALPELDGPGALLEVPRSLLLVPRNITHFGTEWFAPVATDSGYTLLELLPLAKPRGFTACVALLDTESSALTSALFASDSPIDVVVRGEEVNFGQYRDIPSIRDLIGLLRVLGIGNYPAMPPNVYQELGLNELAHCLNTMNEGLAGRAVFSDVPVSDVPEDESELPAGCHIKRERFYSILNTVVESSDCPPTLLPISQEEDSHPVVAGLEEPAVLLELYAKGCVDLPFSNRLVSEVWMNTFGTPVIPFEVNARKVQLADAYRKLDRKIASVEFALQKRAERSAD